MDNELIQGKILDLYNTCEIHSFPINCFEIISVLGIQTIKYSDLPTEKKQYCMLVSCDAFILKDIIYYNDMQINGRLRFSIMHELGHIVMEHSTNRNPEEEMEANYFASHVLAPRMAIHYAGCKNETDVTKVFSLTNEAALYAFNDYKRWHRWTIYHKMNTFDKAMYSYFFNDKLNKFVYNISTCYRCGETLYNHGKCIPCLIYDTNHYSRSCDPAFRYS